MAREMKDSGTWAHKIPLKWKIMIFSLATQKITTGLNPRNNFKLNESSAKNYYVTIRNFKNGKLFLDDNCDKITDDALSLIQKRSNLKKNDILFASISKEGQAYLISNNPQNWNINESVFSIRVNETFFCAKYFYYQITNPAYYESLKIDATGSTFKSIKQDKLKQSTVVRPPLSEQQKIADFLDEKVKEIDNAIEKTKETIELYKKYKQAIITEAVTKGLDPNAEMKDSGVEWIGKIPVSWKVKRAKNVVTEFAKGAGITKEDVDINGDISCVRYGEIYTKYDIDFVQTFSRTNLSQINTPKYIEKGDILFSGTGELVEEIGKNIVYLGNERCIAGGDIIIAKHKCNASFLNYAFKSSYSQMQKSSGKSKLKVVHISTSDIGNILLAIPPACEQESIANYLNQKIDLIDFINKSLNELIPMFENYKKSLIYEYVTGKKEVK